MRDLSLALRWQAALWWLPDLAVVSCWVGRQLILIVLTVLHTGAFVFPPTSFGIQVTILSHGYQPL